jgi:hypothetical protein
MAQQMASQAGGTGVDRLLLVLRLQLLPPVTAALRHLFDSYRSNIGSVIDGDLSSAASAGPFVRLFRAFRDIPQRLGSQRDVVLMRTRVTSRNV